MGLLDSLGITNSSPAKAQSGPANARPTVLLVDDSPDNLLLLREYLKRTPYIVDEAVNGAIAVARVKARKYDFIIMDLLMPEMDGFAAMREIRVWEDAHKSERACIITLTAWALKEAALESYGCGADVHLTKPIRKAKLLEVLDAQWARIAARRVITTSA